MNIKIFALSILCVGTLAAQEVNTNIPSIQAVILAAGRSTRVKTKASKLTFPFCGQELILYPTKVMHKLGIPLIMVVGYQKEIIQDILARNGVPADYVEQTNARGTGHAVLVSRPFWSADHILIVNGDGPLITEKLIQATIDKHMTSSATVTFVTAYNTDLALSVAHVITNVQGKVKVVEHKDFDGDRTIPFIMNAGIYIIKKSFLEENIEKIVPYKNGEIGIPELIHMAGEQNLKVETVDVPLDHVRGVNTQKELSIAEHIKRSELINSWMDKGVRFIDENTTIIDNNVELAPDTIIGAGVHLLQNTKAGAACSIGAYSILIGCTLENNVTVEPFCLLTGVHLAASSRVPAYTQSNKESPMCISDEYDNFLCTYTSYTGEIRSYTGQKS